MESEWPLIIKSESEQILDIINREPTTASSIREDILKEFHKDATEDNKKYFVSSFPVATFLLKKHYFSFL